jgi:hypothetical protein
MTPKPEHERGPWAGALRTDGATVAAELLLDAVCPGRRPMPV